MQTVTSFTQPLNAESNQRHTIMEIITSELYPEESFPAKYFPHIHTLLFNHFIDIIKPQEELWKSYNSNQDSMQIKEAARQTLNFRNLLKNYPQTVVLLYREYIKKFLLFKKAHADPAERDDILQEILARLIEDKIYKIQEKYDFNYHKISSFTSYFMVTVRNIYIDIIRERNVRPLTAGVVHEIDDVADLHGDKKMIDRLLINEELTKFQTILVLYYKTRDRLELCLKVKYRIPVTRQDIEKCFPKCREEDIKILTQDFTTIRDKRVFEKILSVFNYHEARLNKSDTLRKWVNIKVEEIIMHLNRTHGARVYNNKNFADFIALYYQEIKADQRGEIWNRH